MSGGVEVRREVVAWLLAAVLIYFVYLVAAPFLAALTWATVLAIFFFPAHRRVRERVPGRWAAPLLSTVAVSVLLVAPMSWLIPSFISEAAQVIGELPRELILERIEQANEYLSTRLPATIGDPEEMLNDGLRRVREQLGGWAARLAGNLFTFVLDFIVLLLALFYLFRDGPDLVELLRDVSPFEGPRHDAMTRQALDMIAVTISSGFVVALAQGTLGGLAFAVVGMPSPIFWGVITALMSLLPFVGAWTVWVPAGVGLLLSGETGRGIAILVMGGLLVSTVDNVLRPALIAGRSQLNGLLVFISVLGGINTFGLLGVVVGPLVMATAAGLIAGYRESRRAPAG